MEVVYPHSLRRARTIRRRYSDFHHLRAELIKKNPELVSSLPFPSKRFFGSNLDQTFLDRRLEGLQVFPGTVLEMKDLKKDKALQSFLSMDSNENSEDATKMLQQELQETVDVLKDNLRVSHCLQTDLEDLINLVSELIAS